jgi:hypothetical protein
VDLPSPEPFPKGNNASRFSAIAQHGNCNFGSSSGLWAEFVDKWCYIGGQTSPVVHDNGWQKRCEFANVLTGGSVRPSMAIPTIVVAVV